MSLVSIWSSVIASSAASSARSFALSLGIFFKRTTFSGSCFARRDDADDFNVILLTDGVGDDDDGFFDLTDRTPADFAMFVTLVFRPVPLVGENANRNFEADPV